MKKKTQKQAEPSVLKLTDLIIERGLKAGASHIQLCRFAGGHLEIKHQKGTVLHSVDQVPSDLANAVICRLKILAGCDITTKTTVQHGRVQTQKKIRVGKEKRVHDYEITTTPSQHGEGVTIKFLN